MVSAGARCVAHWGGASAFALTLGACQVIGGIDDRRLATEPSPPPPECLTNQQCIDDATKAGPDLTGAPEGYTGLVDGKVPAVCVQSAGKCRRLLTPDCPTLSGDFSNDGAIVLGTFLTVSGTLASSNVPRERSAVLAAEEINSAISGGGLPPAAGSTARRPIVVLNCDPSRDPLGTARHLAVDLKVPAVVGPNVAEDIINVTQEVSKDAGMLLMSPTAPPDPITNLVDDGLTWRAVPSDSQRVKLLIDQLNEVEELVRKARKKEIVKLAIPFRNDALGLSVRDAVSGKLIFNGHYISDPQNSPAVSLDPYPLSDTKAQAAIAEKYATKGSIPDVVLVVANEVVPNIVIPFEQKLRASDPTAEGPYYVAVDVAKVPAWLMAATKPDVLPEFRSRVRGIGLTPDGNSASVFASFNAAYTSRYGTNPATSAMGPSYDSMYSIAYALAATTHLPVTGKSVAAGLRSIASGDSIQVGLNQANNALQQLAEGHSIALRGTHSLMEWDSKGDIIGGTVEVWCIRLVESTAVFASSGKSMDVATQTINGSYEQCK
jgi:ABC-type branched-subunit amino acid transport system substrate-binding protein